MSHVYIDLTSGVQYLFNFFSLQLFCCVSYDFDEVSTIWSCPLTDMSMIASLHVLETKPPVKSFGHCVMRCVFV